jgi:hypothetical protein
VFCPSSEYHQTALLIQAFAFSVNSRNLVDCSYKIRLQNAVLFYCVSYMIQIPQTLEQTHRLHVCATCFTDPLTSQTNSVGEQSISISMVDVLLSSQALEEVIPITTIVRSSLDLVKMGHLVQVGVTLVLSMAS